MKRDKLIEINKFLLSSLILIQPIFNIIRENIINDIQIFGLSFFEMTNVIIIAISFIITLVLNLKNKKFLKTIFSFFIIFISYFVLHYLNVAKFDISVYEKADPSFFVETYYLIITFAVPILYCILLIFCGITKKELLRIIKILIFIITNVVVISNIFSIASTAYYTELDHAYSIFHWFNFNNTSYDSYYALTSKGLFSSANQLSAILFIISPIIMYSAYESRNKFDYYLLFMISLTMLMLGTKTASIGIILIYVIFIFIWFCFRLLKKEKRNLNPILILFSITLLMFCFSPFSYNLRYKLFKGDSMSNFQIIKNEDEEREKSKEKEEKYIEDSETLLDEYIYFQNLSCNELNKADKIRLYDFFEKNLNVMGIPKYILDNYSIKKHICFWHNYLVNYTTNDYRIIKTKILENIYLENNNNYDKFFGIGHTVNFIYTEADYSYQFYCYGIFGMIVLFGYYIYYILIYIIDIIKNYKTKLNFQNLITISSAILIFAIAYYSGHVLERVFPLLILSLVIAYNQIQEDDINNKKILFISSTGGHLSELLQLKSLFNKYDSYIITEKTKSTIDLNNKFSNVNYLVYGTKDHKFIYPFKFIYNCIKSLVLYLKIKPCVIITTGTHTAVPICYIGKLFGSKIIFIETFANSKTKTLSGKLVYPIADTFIVQWKSMLELYPKAVYAGWIY